MGGSRRAVSGTLSPTKVLVNLSPRRGGVTPPPAQPHLPSYVHSSSQIPGPADRRSCVPCPCPFCCLCCPKYRSCRGIRKRRRVLHSTVFGSIVMVTRMRHRMSLPDPLHLSALKRTNPCLLCLDVRGGTGRCGGIGTVAGVSIGRRVWCSIDHARIKCRTSI
jgi:hypothetical protein